MRLDVHGQCSGTSLRRDQLLRRAALAGGALLVPAALAGPAGAATPTDNDLAYVRLLVAAELLAADFQKKALASGRLASRPKTTMEKMAADDRAHYATLAELLRAAGQPPATAADIDFSYPRRSFASQPSTLKVGAEIKSLLLGTYLGAVENVETAPLRLPVGQIAANEAQHAAALAALRGRAVIGRAFAPVLQIDAASAALDRFES
jgi:hypothetical protein